MAPTALTRADEAIRLMEDNATRTLPPGMATEWTAMS
jgi:hypothetical protein